MIAYSRISSEVWHSVNKPEASDNLIDKLMIDYLDRKIQHWQASIPDDLRFYPSRDAHDSMLPSRGQRRLQVILYLRTNQMRIATYRPVLHSTTNIINNMRYSQIVIEVAKDTVRVLSRLNQTSDIYRTGQGTFNYFLGSALAVLFLAVAHAPAEFNRQVRDEFYMALDLVKGFSSKSYISHRLWTTIKGLKEIGSKLGLDPQPRPRRAPRAYASDAQQSAQQSAAVAMASLAGSRVEEMGVIPGSQSSSPIDGQQMSNDLTNLFETAGGYGNGTMSAHVHPINGGFVGSQSELAPGIEGPSGMYGNDGDISRIMKQWF